jgi:hypothetical protein
MARNEMTFTDGNANATKLTQELHDLFVNTIRITGRVTIAAGRCAIGVNTARRWMARGRLEEQGSYHDFVVAVEKAKAEFLLLASKRLNQLALGGRVEMPAWDKNGNPVRDHREDCAAIPGVPCGCPLVLVEKVLLPESRILMWQCDRIDPQPHEPEADIPPGPPALSEEDRVARARADYSLLREALQILEEIGQPLSVSLGDDSIETTAKVAEIFPELPAVTANVPEGNVSEEPATPTDPSDKPPEAF